MFATIVQAAALETRTRGGPQAGRGGHELSGGPWIMIEELSPPGPAISRTGPRHVRDFVSPAAAEQCASCDFAHLGLYLDRVNAAAFVVLYDDQPCDVAAALLDPAVRVPLPLLLPSTRIPEASPRRRHADRIPVDERRRPLVCSDGVARRDVPVAHDLTRRDGLGAFFEAGLGSEARDAVVIGPQQLSDRRELAVAQPPAVGVGWHPPLDPAEPDRAIGLVSRCRGAPSKPASSR